MSIALDATSSISAPGGSSSSFSHTCSGSNRILIVGVSIAQTGNTVSVTGITYNGVALTKIDREATLTSRATELWYLIAPATGAHSISVTLSGTPDAFFNVGAASYTGTNQGLQPSSSGKTGFTSSVTTITQSVTTTADNSWLVGVGCDGATPNPVVQAGTTFRLSVNNRTGNGYELFFLDSNAAKTPAGSFALGWTHDSAAGSIIAAAIMPSVASISMTETTVTSDSAKDGYKVTASDTTHGSDSSSSKKGWRNQPKNSSTWRNQSKN